MRPHHHQFNQSFCLCSTIPQLDSDSTHQFLLSKKKKIVGHVSNAVSFHLSAKTALCSQIKRKKNFNKNFTNVCVLQTCKAELSLRLFVHWNFHGVNKTSRKETNLNLVIPLISYYIYSHFDCFHRNIYSSHTFLGRDKFEYVSKL